MKLNGRPASPTLRVLSATLALGLLGVLLLMPGHPDEYRLSHFLTVPAELPFCVLLLAFTRGCLSRLLRAALVLSVTLLVLLRLADTGSQLAFGRDFSPVAEWHLVGQGWSLAANSVGRLEAALVVLSFLTLLVLVALYLYHALRHVRVSGRAWRPAYGIGMALLLGLGVASMSAGESNRVVASRVQFTAVTELPERLAATRRSIEDQLAFQTMLADDPLAGGEAPGFAGLDGLDVIVLYVESYGRSYLEHPRFVETAGTTLRRFEHDLSAANLSVRSGWLESPVRGGRSWLAHATLASGLPLTNHARFDRLITSDRPSLWSLFGDAGWSTAVVLPAVRDHWNEGVWYDVDRFFDANALDYRGKDFGYVTMPDQFTLAAFQRHVRDTAEGPLAAEIGLLGTHAPWTPLALPVPWDEIGNGEIFDGRHRFGEPLDWANAEPVREMYARSLELSFGRIGEYLQRHGDDALFVILGDHQPAHVIAGWAPDADVPVHFVSADERVLARLPEHYFKPGTQPGVDVASLPMASIREMLARAYRAPLSSERTPGYVESEATVSTAGPEISAVAATATAAETTVDAREARATPKSDSGPLESGSAVRVSPDPMP